MGEIDTRVEHATSTTLDALREDQRPVDTEYRPGNLKDEVFENFEYPSFLKGVFEPQPEKVIKEKIALALEKNKPPLELFSEIFGYLAAWRGLTTIGKVNGLYPYHVTMWIDQDKNRISKILKEAKLPINFQALNDDSHELVLKAIRAYAERDVARIKASPRGERQTLANNPDYMQGMYDQMLEDVNLMFYFLKKWNVITQEAE